MPRSHERVLSAALVTSVEALGLVETAAMMVCKNIEDSNISIVLQDTASYTISDARLALQIAIANATLAMTRLEVVSHFHNLETVAGAKSTFREVYDRTTHIVRAVIQLRTDFPEINVHDARIIVEAYRDQWYT